MAAFFPKALFFSISTDFAENWTLLNLAYILSSFEIISFFDECTWNIQVVQKKQHRSSHIDCTYVLNGHDTFPYYIENWIFITIYLRRIGAFVKSL